MTCHIAAPRGSKTQGLAWELATKVPEQLSNALRLAAEKDFKDGKTWRNHINAAS